MQLTYQDALDLKEAGFPQKLHCGSNFYPYKDSNERVWTEDSESFSLEHVTDMPHCWCNPGKTVVENGNMVISHNEEILIIPTLEELIEALPKEHYLCLQQAKNRWRASIAKDNNEIYEAVYGSSPVQAVKNLYCALNKK